MMEPTGTIEDVIKELLSSDEEAACEYLKESFLLQAMSALFHARRNAGLTQAQLAERLHTRQSSIARLERDLTGSVTLKRFVEVAIACGAMPLDITLAPVEQVVRYAAEAPDAARTSPAFSRWQAAQAPQSPTPTLSLAAPTLVSVGPLNANTMQAQVTAPSSPTLGQAMLWPEKPALSLISGQLGGRAA